MNKKTNKLVGAGVLSAVAASLCCITPVLALISGASGLASAFSWMEPARPYLIGITVLVLGFAWFQKLKPQKEIECDCEEDEKKPFLQTKLFLGIITVFAALMLAFPYYTDIFYPKNDKKQVVIVKASDIQSVKFNVTGVSCEACNAHIEHEVNKLAGVISVHADYKTGTAKVEFDSTRVDNEKLTEAINSTGYKVKGKE